MSKYRVVTGGDYFVIIDTVNNNTVFIWEGSSDSVLHPDHHDHWATPPIAEGVDIEEVFKAIEEVY